MVTMQPRPEFVQYRANMTQWRVWNVTTSNWPPYALVAVCRDVAANRLARTAYDMHPDLPRHSADLHTDNQITYEAVSGPQATWKGEDDPEQEPFGYHTGIEYATGFPYAQSAESYLALFDRPVRRNATGLATQQWPVLTRFVGDVADIPDAWPRYAVPDLDKFGVKLHDDGPFQILAIDPNRLPDCRLVWIAPRQRPYRDAWAVGGIDLATGSGAANERDWQEITGGVSAVNSPGGDDILTIENGRIVAHKLGIYRGTVTAIANGNPPDQPSPIRIGFAEPAVGDVDLPDGGYAAMSYGWLPEGTNETDAHSHTITLSGGAAGSRPWDRTTSVITYSKEFTVSSPDQLPWQAKMMWQGGDGDTVSRVRYSVEYLGPRWRDTFLPSGGTA